MQKASFLKLECKKKKKQQQLQQITNHINQTTTTTTTKTGIISINRIQMIDFQCLHVDCNYYVQLSTATIYWMSSRLYYQFDTVSEQNQNVAWNCCSCFLQLLLNYYF